ncbi:MAG: zinc ribbon domain-containing protein [Kiritimatiellae bacterium]|nr:zinc ribbon domain-containing protein [Kiritimatiellia bacterium]MDW8458135.1 zinc ribbon domain-containing protein [Verrucomicrobiota bacterium]
MPTYEYECKKCGVTFEKFQRISEKPLRRCPECRGSVSRKVGAGAGLLFKGSGFYITDYRSENYKKSAKADSGGSADSSKSPSSPGGKSDAGASSSTSKKVESKA